MKRTTISRPSNHAGSGGIVNRTSSASRLARRSTSAASQAATNSSTSRRTPSSPSAASSACCDLPWVRSAIEARARWSALFTLGTDVSSSSATSAAENCSTSRSNSSRPLGARQVLQRRDVRELDALTPCVRRLGVARVVRLIGPRLQEPVRGVELTEISGLGETRAEIAAQHAVATPRHLLETRVGGDPEQPGPHRAAPLEAVPAAPRANQSLLQRVLGVVRRAQHPVAVCEQLTTVSGDRHVELA